jgi:hypothetical protein
MDLTAPKPAGLQFVTQTQAIPGQRGGAFRIRWHPVSRRFEDKSKLLAESVTIAREAAPAFQFHDTVGTALEPNIVSDPLCPTAELDGLYELTHRAGIGPEGRSPPRRIAFERKRSRRIFESIDRDFHTLHRSRSARARAHPPAAWKVSKNNSLGGSVR